jgi:phytoene synthase
MIDGHREKTTPSLSESYRHCEALASAHYENFPVASLFVPSAKRKHIAAIYVFARTADDFADEPGRSPQERLQALSDWESQLMESSPGNSSDPCFIALHHTIKELQIPPQLLRDLLTAFRTDVTTTRYRTFDDLLNYCRCSANPIGRLVLLIFGYNDERLFSLSDDICTALQLTNFWQDLSIDIKRNRLYIPLDDIERFGCDEQSVMNGQNSPVLRELLAFEVDRTRKFFDRGKSLLFSVKRDVAFELRLTWNGGKKILNMIERQQYDVFSHRPSLRFFNKIGVFFSTLNMKRP